MISQKKFVQNYHKDKTHAIKKYKRALVLFFSFGFATKRKIDYVDNDNDDNDDDNDNDNNTTSNTTSKRTTTHDFVSYLPKVSDYVEQKQLPDEHNNVMSLLNVIHFTQNDKNIFENKYKQALQLIETVVKQASLEELELNEYKRLLPIYLKKYDDYIDFLQQELHKKPEYIRMMRMKFYENK